MATKGLPPLNFLPAFEAAGRLGSFKAAAQLLHLTPSAISQQIKALEDALGVILFERDGRGAKLTLEGERYLSDVTATLAQLGDASRRLQNTTETVLRVSTVDFVAYEFLVPRLSAFRRAFPNVDLRIDISMGLADFERDEVDAAIRVGSGPWPGLVATSIGKLSTAVVSSAEVARSINGIPDVHTHPLLEMRGQEHRGWTAYVKSLGVAGRDIQVITLGSYFECMRAAEQGLGIAFGVFPLTSEWVANGRLSVPLPERVPAPGDLSWVVRPVDQARPLFIALHAWLSEQYAQLSPLPAGRLIAP